MKIMDSSKKEVENMSIIIASGRAVFRMPRGRRSRHTHPPRTPYKGGRSLFVQVYRLGRGRMINDEGECLTNTFYDQRLFLVMIQIQFPIEAERLKG